jgi:RNA polymerase sigma-70 factor (sigma-E family)
LLRTAVLLKGSRVEGEDLLQDALERCSRRWPRQVEHPAAYVRTTMVRLAGRRRHRLLLPLLQDPPSGVDDGVQSEQRVDLLAALRQLPTGQRAAVVLRHWEGYSEAETADTLDCTVGTVKSQTSRGLRRLRELMTPTQQARPAEPVKPIDADQLAEPGLPIHRPTGTADHRAVVPEATPHHPRTNPHAGVRDLTSRHGDPR